MLSPGHTFLSPKISWDKKQVTQKPNEDKHLRKWMDAHHKDYVKNPRLKTFGSFIIKVKLSTYVLLVVSNTK